MHDQGSNVHDTSYQPNRKTLPTRFLEFSISTYWSYTVGLQIKLLDVSRQRLFHSQKMSQFWIGSERHRRSAAVPLPTSCHTKQHPVYNRLRVTFPDEAAKRWISKVHGHCTSGLAELPFPSIHQSSPQVTFHRHQVTVIKAGATSTPQTHTYEIQASEPGAHPAHIVQVGQTWRFGHQVAIHSVRTWHPKSLDKLASDKRVPLNSIDQLVQPFNALLLKKFCGRQYKRIVADCMIYSCTQDLPSTLHEWEHETPGARDTECR